MSDVPDLADRGVTLRPRILAIGFGLLAAILFAVLIWLVLQSNHERDAALARKQHSFDVMMLTSEADASLAKAEASLGRYVIDKDQRTGMLYFDAWRHAGRQLDLLSDLVADNPPQMARMRALQRLYEQRGVELAAPATLIVYKQQWQALSLYARAGRSDVLPQISRLLRAMSDAESTLFDERSTNAAESVRRSNSLSRLLSAVGVLLTLSAIAAGWLAVRALAERQSARERAQSEIDRTQALERAVAERTRELREANSELTREAGVRAEAEAKLRQIQKMEAVGQLTGGIAHDFNNMLAVVLGALELARRRIADQAADTARHLDNAMEGANRAAALTRRLLSFARAEPLLPSHVDAGQLIAGMSDLIDRTIGERIAVRLAPEADVWPVWVDPYQLENAILNLCVNARDAMEGAGTLGMSAGNVRLDNDEGSLAAGDYVRIAVSDDGKGMSPKVLERVFEPFFTTKPAGEGTGLGLSQIFGFARQSGGDVTIRSAEGAGTTVSIFLPRHLGAAGEMGAPAEPTAISAPFSPHERATILVVEDDPRVRAATCEALSELGHDPLPAPSGEEALALLARRADITLIITDVIMPGMTGPELAARVRQLHPALSLIFVTGYVGDAGDVDTLGGHDVLRKPFTLAALASTVEAALAAGCVPEERAA